MSVLLDRPRRARRGSIPSPTRLLTAVAALFAFDGAVFGSWAARIPDVTTQVGASHTALGLALLCVSIGALASMQLAGALCARLGAGLVASVSAVLICVAVTLPGLARTLPELGAALLAFGAATGAVNVAANSAGVRLEAAGDRPIMPGLHAAFSFGGLFGAAVGGVASGLGGVATHLLAVGAVGVLLTAAIAPVLVAGDAGRQVSVAPAAEPRHASTAPRRLLVVLGLIAGCTAYGEGAITDWGALHLRETLAATPAMAAAGYAAFSLAMACGRLLGSRLVRSFGATHVLVLGSALAAIGMLAAALAPSAEVALAGFALVGLGLANVFPLAIARAGALGGSKGVALASTVGYTGLLGGPPLIGLLVGGVGLPAALTTVSLLAAVAGALSLYATPQRALVHARVAGALDAGRERAVAGLAPAVVRYGPSMRRWADDLTLLGAADGSTAVPAPTRTLTPLTAVYLR
ncbi:MFS transporter [Pseudonocardia charpentierae]|uniref:MFS transporter n=1 Tax=Pseudonocardia charpentierae TaxID=3075545 RepID=A0ABU2N875_9PSEU|nr:MFS transporter [Pseudonocardia sp. DSM 45834]MDT0350150.1 MFS transporter [Pseudonocardia sp. DSM 45834]